MNTVTGEYAAAYQFKEDVVRRVVEAMFAVGEIDHTRPEGNGPTDFLIGRPETSLTPGAGAKVRTRAIWGAARQAQPSYVSAEFDAVGRVNAAITSYGLLRVAFEGLGAVVPGTGLPDPRWQGTGMGAVLERLAIDRHFAGEWRRPLMEILPDRNGPVASLAFDYEGDAVTGQGPSSSFVRDAWALAVGAEEIVRRVLASAKNAFGKLPSPETGPVIVSGHTLTKFTVTVTADRIEVSGHVDPLGWPAADFIVPVTLSVANGMVVGTAAEAETTYVGVVPGVVFDSGLKGQLRARVQGIVNGVFDFMSPNALFVQNVAVARPVVTGVEVTAAAVVAHGSVEIPTIAQGPVAKFTVNAFENRLLMDRDRDFDATGCWAPSGAITEMIWNFGDGTPVSRLTGDQLRLKLRHSFAPGSYWVSLKVVDDAGRTATAIRQVTVGVLTLDHVNSRGPSWMACAEVGQINAFFSVKCGADDANGSVVTCRSETWTIAKETVGGGVIITLPPGAAGEIHVEATRPNYEGDARMLRIGDCTLYREIMRIGKRAAEALQRWPVPPGPPPVIQRGWEEFIERRALVADILAIAMVPNADMALAKLGRRLGLKGTPKAMLRGLGPIVTGLGSLAKQAGLKPARSKVARTLPN